MKVNRAVYQAVYRAVSGAALSGLVVGTVLVVHTNAAFAQQPAQPEGAPAAPQAEAAPQEDPPGYGPPPGYAPAAPSTPPPGYGQPPPRYSYYPPPPPPPPRSRPERPFMIGGSLGLGGLRFLNNDDPPVSAAGPATGYSGRLGFGLSPRVLLLLGVDGAVSVEDALVYSQNIYYLGAQFFMTRQVFLRAGGGIGNITGRDNYGDFLYFGKTGLGLTGSIGVEMLQGYNWSLELAGMMTAGFYKDETWTSGTVNIGFNFF
jgi:hypothetical protein